MKKISLLEIGVLSVFLILVSIFAVWVFLLKKPTTGINCHTHSHWLWNKDCLSFQEKSYDSNLKSPKNIKPYLVSFTHAEGGGPPIYLPLWYRFRYVNVNTGGYSDFSEWTSSPVLAGSCHLPCVGDCHKGFSTCMYNQPVIGVSEKDASYDPTKALPNGDYVYMNLHRYVGESANDLTPPPSNAQDEIIGFLALKETHNGTSYYTFVDAEKNPCLSRSCPIPSWCQKQSKC